MNIMLKNIKDFILKQLSSYKKQPWILCIGSPQSGKTSLFANTSFLTSINGVTKNNIQATQNIDAWINKQIVFLDPAGKLFNDILPLLKYCKQCHGNKVLNGLLICIDITLLQEKNTLDKIIEKINAVLDALHHYKVKCPVSMVITQCDHIPGFSDFFSSLGEEELAQSFGFTLSKSKTTNKTLFQKQFSQLIERLSKRLLWRLHHEQNLAKRQSLSQMPIYFEMLSSVLQPLLEQVNWEPCYLIGIFFVSSTQSSTTTHPLILQIQQHLQLPITQKHAAPKTSQTYFIEEPLKTLTQFAIYHAQETPSQWPRWISFLIAAVIIILITSFWHTSFNSNLNAINNVQIQLNQIDANNTHPIWLGKLNALYHSQQFLNKQPSIFRITGFDQIYRLNKKIKQRYDTQLAQQFKPYLLNTLVNTIQNNLSNGNPLTLYNALHIYLMATTPNKYNGDAIKQWFLDQWSNQYVNDANSRDALQQHLNQLMTSNKLQWLPNNELIKQAQTALQKLPLSKIVFLELQGNYNQKNITILPHANKMMGIDLTQASIPPFYSSDNFQQIYQQDIPKLADKLIKGDWVIGNQNTDFIKINKTILIADIRQEYLHYFTQNWLDMISKIRLTPATNFDELQRSIQLLTQPKSALTQLLTLVVGNATLIKDQQTDVVHNPSYQAVSQFLQHKGNYAEIISTLNALQAYVNQINQTVDSDKASYDAAVIRLQQKGAGDPIYQLLQLGKNAPEPIQAWLTNIADNTWKILLSNAKNYLNTVWSTTVIPDYNNTITKHYPIFDDSDDNVSFDDFTHFFGPNGSIDIFFTRYLIPFVNMQSAYWTWKTLDNQSIPISQKTLNMLLRASIIQQMFYTNDHDHISFTFSIALADSQNVRSSTLNINGTLIQLNNTHPIVITWPHSKDGITSLQITTKDNDSHTWTESGPWSLFQLIQNGLLNNLGSPQQFELTFHLKNSQIRYQITAETRVNPFIPNIVNKFRLPQEL